MPPPTHQPVNVVQAKTNLASGLKTTSHIPTSVDALKEQISLQQQAQELKAAQEKNTSQNRHFFSQTMLQEAWNACGEMMKAKTNAFQQTIFEQPISLNDNYLITITLSNPLQKTYLEPIKPEVLKFLKGKLLNDFINIETEIKETERKEKVLYTSKDKFDYLVGKFPIINKLKNDLGLDID